MKSHRLDFDTVRATFDRDGYVELPQFVPPHELTRILANVARFIENVVPTMPRDEVFYEDKGDRNTLKQIQRMHEHDGFFGKLIGEGPFRQVAEMLLKDAVVPKNLQYFNKPPGVGQPTPAHQDGYYFMLEPCEAVTMWFALDEVDEENGCVRYIPTSHRRGMRPHGKSGTLGFSQTIVDYDATDGASEVAMTAKPGDLLVHHALTIHLASGNRSKSRNRRSLGFVYFAQQAQVDEARQQAYRQQLTEELTATGKI